jgi:hypothetical protein
MTRRGTSNTNSRGSSRDRKRRRQYLVEKFGSPTGKTICCFHCGKRMHVNASVRRWEVDRYPTCGHAGGRYTRDNIVPACRACNGTRCTTVCRGKAKQRIAPWRKAVAFAA